MLWLFEKIRFFPLQLGQLGKKTRVSSGKFAVFNWDVEKKLKHYGMGCLIAFAFT